MYTLYVSLHMHPCTEMSTPSFFFFYFLRKCNVCLSVFALIARSSVVLSLMLGSILHTRLISAHTLVGRTFQT